MAEALEKLFDGQEPISAYGVGGFRFARRTHRGSLLILPEATFSWPVQSIDDIAPGALQGQDRQLDFGDFLLLGTGEQQAFPGEELRALFDRLGIVVEAMNTGAACRTYNLLLAEKRVFSAGLIAA